LRRRVYRDTALLAFTPCCPRTFDSLGVDEDIIARQLRVLPLRSPFEPSGMAQTLGERFRGRDGASLKSWSDDFYLLDRGAPVAIKAHPRLVRLNAARGSHYTPLKLVSKQPLFFNWLVYLDCKDVCQIALVDAEGPPAYPPKIAIFGVAALASPDCEERPEGCQTQERLIEDIPRKLHALEEMFERLRVRPTSAEERS